jgi:hypothetical protein
MRKLALAALLAAVNSASAQYVFVLKFPDGSSEICPGTGFTIDFATITANVQDCALDKVFKNGFGG